MFLLNWAIPGKIQAEGIEDILFWKRPLKFLDLSLYPWKFQTKWRFTPGNSTKSCYTHWNFQGQKPRPMEIPHYFFLIMPGNSNSFLLTPGVSRFYFFNPPGNSMSSTPSTHCFFFVIALEVVTASQTKTCKLLIQQSTRFWQRTPKPCFLTFVLVLCQP